LAAAEDEVFTMDRKDYDWHNSVIPSVTAIPDKKRATLERTRSSTPNTARPTKQGVGMEGKEWGIK
jgi:hypothetical protein